MKDTADDVEMLIKNPWGEVELLLPFQYWLHLEPILCEYLS